jgi:diketogulonate reductase-like aldo/keto reductase
MKLKRLGNSPVQLSEIAFGTWKYSGGVAPLRAAIEQGACLIDTAETYGTEAVVGEAIKGLRSRVFLATKARPRNFRRRDLVRAADRSLAELATDYIDLYQLHWPNLTVPIEETMQVMAELADAGKIRFIGVSNFTLRQLQQAQAALPRYAIVSNQVPYSLIDRTVERDLMDYCWRNGVTILAYSPLGSGLANIRAADPEGVLARVAVNVNKTEAQVALNWVTAKKGVIAITKGSTPERVLENFGSSGWRLAPEELELLSRKIRFRQRSAAHTYLRELGRHAFQVFGKRL